MSGQFRTATPNSSDPQHARVDDVPRGAHDEEVAEALVEDDLGRHLGVGTAEEDGEGVLLEGDPIPEVHVLVRVGPFVGDEPRAFRRHPPGLVRGPGARSGMSWLPLDHVEDAISAPLGDGRASEDTGVWRGPPLRSRSRWVRRRRRDAR